MSLVAYGAKEFLCLCVSDLRFLDGNFMVIFISLIYLKDKSSKSFDLICFFAFIQFQFQRSWLRVSEENIIVSCSVLANSGKVSEFF